MTPPEDISLALDVLRHDLTWLRERMTVLEDHVAEVRETLAGLKRQVRTLEAVMFAALPAIGTIVAIVTSLKGV